MLYQFNDHALALVDILQIVDHSSHYFNYNCCFSIPKGQEVDCRDGHNFSLCPRCSSLSPSRRPASSLSPVEFSGVLEVVLGITRRRNRHQAAISFRSPHTTQPRFQLTTVDLVSTLFSYSIPSPALLIPATPVVFSRTYKASDTGVTSCTIVSATPRVATLGLTLNYFKRMVCGDILVYCNDM